MPRRDSDYDWQGFFGAVADPEASSILIAGPEDQTLTTLASAYDPELLTTDAVGNFIRSIGLVELVVGQTTSTGIVGVYWTLQWVNDIRIIDEGDIADQARPDALSSNDVLAFGNVFTYANESGVVNDAGSNGARWDVASTRKGDDMGALVFSYTPVNPGIAPNFSVNVRGRNLFVQA